MTKFGRKLNVKGDCWICGEKAVMRFKGLLVCRTHLCYDLVDVHDYIEGCAAPQCAIAQIDEEPIDGRSKDQFNWHRWLKQHSKKNGREKPY